MFPVRSIIPGSKVDEFKEILVGISCIPASSQRLIYKGMILKDDRTLDSYGLQAYHTIHMVISPQNMFDQTETTPPSNCGGHINAAAARAPNVSGLGGLGLHRLTGGMTDMLCPAISQMIQTLLSTPHIMDQIIGQNPQLQSIFHSNPQLREMMQNPEVVRQLTSPHMMQAILSESDNFLAADI
nr:hypothetical protein [Tanacetum cinerariifolium]